MMDAELTVLVTAFVAAFVNGGLGYGFSSVLVPIALLFHPNALLNPALVCIEVFLNLAALFVNRRAIAAVAPRVWPMLVGCVPGVLLGSSVLVLASPSHLKIGTYAVLLPLIVLQSIGLRWPVRREKVWGVPLGAGIGTLYSATTISGPPLALLFNNQGLTRDEFRAALALFRVTEAVLTAATYLALGVFTRDSVALSSTLLPAVLVGLPLGTWAMRSLRPDTFRSLCMGLDAVLVSFGLGRACISVGYLQPIIAHLLTAAVVVAEAAIFTVLLRRRMPMLPPDATARTS